MAKFKFHHSYDAFPFDGDLILNINSKGTKAVWTDDITGAKIITEGHDLKGGGSDLLSSGKIESVTIIDAEGEKYLSVTGLKANARTVTDIVDSYGAEAGILYLARKADRVIGSNEDDFLVGGRHDDVMTGKAGSDYFVFSAEMQNAKSGKHVEFDTITDFDTTGADRDYLALPEEFDFRGVHKGEDTLLTFSDGSKLLLEHVTKAEFQTYLTELASML
ncbi:MAG: calcium-binding protein [Rhizobiaceae bacterium]|nr:calcium-binding protein [Rhizobiaceae bacterium]